MCPLYLILFFLVGYTFKVFIWIGLKLTGWWYFRYIYPWTYWLWASILLNFFALTFTYVILETWTTYWFVNQQDYLSYVSLAIGLILFVIFCCSVVGLVTWKIIKWVLIHPIKDWNLKAGDSLFSDLVAWNMIQTYVVFYLWRLLLVIFMLVGRYMEDFPSVCVFLTIQLFAFKGHVYWWPFKDSIYYSGLVICEFAVSLHGFILLIFTSSKIPYNTWYVIGYFFHAVILLLFTSLLVIKYFTLCHRYSKV